MRFRHGVMGFSVAVVVSGCSADAAPKDHSDTVASNGAVAGPIKDSSSNVAPAERVLREYLDASRESSLDPAVLNALGACGDGGQSFFPTTMLAGYTLQPFEMRGDTVVGRAEVVTVAEQDIDRRDGGRFQARLRVRTDVLEWDIIPLDHGDWVVCNGLRFGYLGADSATTWRPEGASYARARQLADSIFAARQ